MEKIIIKNPTSNISHEITFKKRGLSNSKIIILLDGRLVGKINKSSKSIFAYNSFVYNVVKENINNIITNDN